MLFEVLYTTFVGQKKEAKNVINTIYIYWFLLYNLNFILLKILKNTWSGISNHQTRNVIYKVAADQFIVLSFWDHRKFIIYHSDSKILKTKLFLLQLNLTTKCVSTNIIWYKKTKYNYIRKAAHYDSIQK